MITEELTPCLQGVIPATITTCNKDGVPNVTIISQVYPVDDNHVAVSNQFFSKTFKNLAENPYACVQVLNPEDFTPWILTMKLVRIEKEGDLFDAMDMQLMAIASMTGMEDVFKLQSAYVFELVSVEYFGKAIE